MTRWALDVHPDDRDLWLRMTGWDETRPYDMPPLRDVTYMLESAARDNVRVEAREIPEVPS